MIFKTSLLEAFQNNRLNKVKDLMVGFTKNYGSVFIKIVMNGVFDHNMAEQNFIDLYKISTKTYPSIVDVDFLVST